LSRFDRGVGLVRSLAIYRSIPFRAYRLRRLYRRFVNRDDLVFDLGGHVGNRTQAFASLGCRVVVVEANPDFARLLRRRFANEHSVQVVEAAVSASVGRARLAISDRTPTVSTLVESWRDARAAEEGFAGVRWNRSIEVETVTLDHLIMQYGNPTFVKIDVEGAEPHVLGGLTSPVRGVSFEYLHGDLDRARHCVERLCSLCPYRFNWSVGETNQLAASEWLNADDLLAALRTAETGCSSGDVYARRNEAGTASH
jgi:FkbM family methyltransferase